jgi:hypothetical protein
MFLFAGASFGSRRTGRIERESRNVLEEDIRQLIESRFAGVVEALTRRACDDDVDCGVGEVTG